MNAPVILGAGGFLGSRLAMALLEKRHAVRLFDRSYTGQLLTRVETYRSRAEVLEGSLESPLDLARAIRGSSAVFHFISASVPSTSPVRLDVEIKTNLPNTLKIIHSMLDHGVERIFYPSSGGAIYGENPDGMHTETSPLRPAGAYGMGKFLAEETLRYYRRTSGLKDVIVRISNAYGAVERTTFRQGAIDVFLRRHREGKPVQLWGDGSAVRDYVHVDDVIESLVRLYEANLAQTEVNIGLGTGASVLEVIDTINRVSGAAVKIEHMEGMYAGLSRSVLDVRRLAELTGYTPQTGLEAGIARCWSALM